MSEDYWFFSYLPVRDELIRRGFYVTSVGRQHTSPGEHFPPREHPLVYHFQWEVGRTLPEFAVVLFTEGSGEYESKDTGKQTIDSNSVVLIAPGQWHRYRPDPETGYTEHWICFNGEIPHDLLDRGLLDPVNTVMRVEHPAELISQFGGLLDYVHEQPGTNSISLIHYAMALLGMVLVVTHRDQEPIQTITAPQEPQTSDSLLYDALELIWTYSHGPLTVGKIVAQLPTTRRTLERRFLSILGRSILDEINTCRLSRAKRLLSETNLILKRVAYLSGFSSPDRMRLVFLKYMNVTPTQYRQERRGIL